jgi:hypothetical protein
MTAVTNRSIRRLMNGILFDCFMDLGSLKYWSQVVAGLKTLQNCGWGNYFPDLWPPFILEESSFQLQYFKGSEDTSLCFTG